MTPEVLSLGIAVASLAVAVLTLGVGTVVSVLLYRFGRRLDFRSRMGLWDELRDQMTSLLRVEGDALREVILMNARRYERDYDGGNDAGRLGYIMGKHELLDVRHNGIEVTDSVVSTWIRSDGSRSLRPLSRKDKERGRGENVYLAGFVPFEFIEHINPSGDEYRGEPIVQVRYNGPGRSPFVSYRYLEAKSFRLREGGRQYFHDVPEFGDVRPNRLWSWLRYQRWRIRDGRMNRQSRRSLRKAGLLH